MWQETGSFLEKKKGNPFFGPQNWQSHAKHATNTQKTVISHS
jgi:hypothetical protein